MDNTRSAYVTAPTYNAIAYVRISEDLLASEGKTVQFQREKELREYCQHAQLRLDTRTIWDTGALGSTPLPSRSGGQELLQRLEYLVRFCDPHVVALNLHQLFGDAREALHQLKAWHSRRITVHLVNIRCEVSNRQPIGSYDLFIELLDSLARWEHDRVAERTTVAIAQRKSQHKRYSTTPYGFTLEGDELREHPTEQAAIQLMQDWYKAGWSLRRIVRNWINGKYRPSEADAGIPQQ